jgi:tungstate transport system ATP-binding protein
MSRKGETTVIFTTHNPNRAYHLAQEVITLYQGNIVKSSYENVFYGQIVGKVSNGVGLFDTGKIQFRVVSDKKAVRCMSINPESIIVSKESIYSSAGNSFQGIIIRISEASPLISLTVRAGEDFKVKITKQSFKEMDLALGSKVYLTFKTTSTEIF